MWAEIWIMSRTKWTILKNWKRTRDFVLAHDKSKIETWGCNNNDGITLCGGSDNKEIKVCDECHKDGNGWKEWLKVMDGINDSGLEAKDFKYYRWLWVGNSRL